jgi:hypothetical protein
MSNPFFEAFLDGFTGGGLFTKLRPPGAATQVFGDESEEAAPITVPNVTSAADHPTSSQRE